LSRRGAILENTHFDPLTFEYQNRGVEQDLQRQHLAQQLAIHKDAQKAAAKAASQKESNDFISKIGLEDVGNNSVDILTHNQLDKVKTELMDMQAKGADIQAIRIAAQNKLPAIVNGHTIAKNKLAEINKGLIEKGKDYPTGDLQRAKEFAVTAMLKDILNLDPKGNTIGYKDPSVVPERNYLSPLTEPENIDVWYPKGEQAWVKNVTDTRGLVPIDGKTKTINSKGGYEMNQVKGHISIYDKPVLDEDGKVKGIELDTEPIHLGRDKNGEPIIAEAMPKEKFQVWRGSGAAALEWDRKFNTHLQEDLGINPKSLDPQSFDAYQRIYAADVAKQTNLHGSRVDVFPEVKANPIKNITNIRLGKDVPVIDSYTAIKNAAVAHFDAAKFNPMISQKDGKPIIGGVPANSFNQTEKDVIMAEAKSSDSEIKSIDDVYVKMYGNDVAIVRSADDKPLTILTPIGSNLEANKALGIKSKQKAVKEAEKGADNKRGGAGKTFVKGIFDNL